MYVVLLASLFHLFYGDAPAVVLVDVDKGSRQVLLLLQLVDVHCHPDELIVVDAPAHAPSFLAL